LHLTQAIIQAVIRGTFFLHFPPPCSPQNPSPLRLTTCDRLRAIPFPICLRLLPAPFFSHPFSRLTLLLPDLDAYESVQQDFNVLPAPSAFFHPPLPLISSQRTKVPLYTFRFHGLPLFPPPQFFVARRAEDHSHCVVSLAKSENLSLRQCFPCSAHIFVSLSGPIAPRPFSPLPLRTNTPARSTRPLVMKSNPFHLSLSSAV